MTARLHPVGGEARAGLVTGARLLLVACTLWVAVAAVVPVTASAADPHPLWQTYPLGPQSGGQRADTSAPSSQRSIPGDRAAASRTETTGGPALKLALVALVMTFLGLAVLTVRALPRWRPELAVVTGAVERSARVVGARLAAAGAAARAAVIRLAAAAGTASAAGARFAVAHGAAGAAGARRLAAAGGASSAAGARRLALAGSSARASVGRRWQTWRPERRPHDALPVAAESRPPAAEQPERKSREKRTRSERRAAQRAAERERARAAERKREADAPRHQAGRRPLFLGAPRIEPEPETTERGDDQGPQPEPVAPPKPAERREDAPRVEGRPDAPTSPARQAPAERREDAPRVEGRPDAPTPAARQGPAERREDAPRVEGRPDAPTPPVADKRAPVAAPKPPRADEAPPIEEPPARQEPAPRDGAAAAPPARADEPRAPAPTTLRAGKDARRAPDPEPQGEAERCEIVLERDGRHAEFRVVAPATDDGSATLIARSAAFRAPAVGPVPPWGRPRELFDGLASQLSDAGWTREHVRGAWHRTAFVREASASPPTGDERCTVVLRRMGRQARWKAMSVDPHGRATAISASPPFTLSRRPRGPVSEEGRSLHAALLFHLERLGWALEDGSGDALDGVTLRRGAARAERRGRRGRG